MIIYNASAQPIVDFQLTDECIHSKSLMQYNYLTVIFNWGELLSFPAKSYLTYNGVNYIIQSDPVVPLKKDNGYRYEIKFLGIEEMFKNVLYLLPASESGSVNESAFTFTGLLSDMAKFANTNISRIMPGLMLAPVVSNDTRASVTFDSDSVFSALNKIAEAFKIEWWTENGNSLHFGKCNINGAVNLDATLHSSSFSVSEGEKEEYATRIYPYGSTRNIVTDATTSQNILSVLNNRLRIDDPRGYIQSDDDKTEKLTAGEIVEKVLIYEDIYPRLINATMSNVVQATEDGIPVYYFKCLAVDFNINEYKIPGLIPMIHIDSNILQGWDFEVSYDSTKSTFRITPEQQDNDIYVPNSALKPTDGSLFVLYNIKMPPAYIASAKTELITKAKEYLSKISEDKSVYSITTNPVHFASNDLNFELGQAVSLTLPNGKVRASRVQGFEKKMYNSYLATYTIGDNSEYSRLTSLEKKITTSGSGTSYASSSSGGGNGSGSNPSVYLITKTDATAPADTNAFSSLRSLSEFLSKKENDRAKGIIVFENGIDIGEAYAGGVIGGRIDADANAELKSLKLRDFLEVPEYRFNRVEIIMEEQWCAKSGGIIESVDTVNKFATLKLEKNEPIRVKAGDICKTIYHTGNGFETLFFSVVSVIDATGQFKYDKRYTTQADLMSGMHFVGYGSFTDPERRKSAYQTTKYTRYLAGVANYDITSENIMAQIGDLSDLSIGGVSMQGYSAYLNRIYLTGVIKQISQDGVSENYMPFYKGDWSASQRYSYYDEVTHNGSLWLCINTSGTLQEPSDTADDWAEISAKGKDAISLEIIASSGADYYREGGVYNATLTAVVKSGTTDITQTLMAISPNSFVWERDTGNAEADAIWNAGKISLQTGNVLTLTNVDLIGDTYIILSVYDRSGLMIKQLQL